MLSSKAGLAASTLGIYLRRPGSVACTLSPSGPMSASVGFSTDRWGHVIIRNTGDPLTSFTSLLGARRRTP